ncbi:MAG TPA: sulfurtransferase TusA family protein [Dermatophilaceae bacterium]|nr:sulfurtransferase TusA family protein [Dermatophilaceae bacterium]
MGQLGDGMHLIDGGDRGCGELLLAVHATVKSLPEGTLVRILASDPAAPIDIPAWCYLTGHRYQGQARHHERAAYDVELGPPRPLGRSAWVLATDDYDSAPQHQP